MWNNDNNIEYLLRQEIQEKKRTASGAFHNSGKRGGGNRGVSSVKSAVDMLKWNNKKAYKEYIKSGEIQLSNIYDEITKVPSVTELEAKEFKIAQSIVRTVKGKHTIKKLCQHWEVSAYTLYKIFRTYKVEYKHKDKEGKVKLQTAVHDENSNITLFEEQSSLLKESKELQEAYQKKLDESVSHLAIIQIQAQKAMDEDIEELQLKYIKKDVIGKDIQDRIINYMGILAEDKKYDIKLVIRELKKDE